LGGDSIVLSATVVMVLTLLARVVGFVREQAMASAFGAGALTDAYVLALNVTSFSFTPIVAILASAYLPVYASYRARGDLGGAAAFARTVMVATVGMCLLISAFGVVFSPALVRAIAPGFDAGTKALAARMTSLLFPAAAAAAVGALCTSALNSHRVFGLPALAPVVTNVCALLGLLLLVERLSVIGMAVAMAIGLTAGLVIQLPALRPTGLLTRGPYALSDGSVKLLLQMSGPILLGAATGQVYSIVEKFLASGLEAGSIAALSYAQKIVQLPSSIVVAAIATVMFPRFSDFFSKRDMPGLKGPEVEALYRRGAQWLRGEAISPQMFFASAA